MEAGSQQDWERTAWGQAKVPVPGKEAETPALDFFLLLAAGRRLLFKVTLLAILVGAVVAFVLKATYTATATIMPPQAPQSTLSSFMGQLGSLASLSGGAANLLKNPSDLYIGILQSRTIADRAIARFHLQQHWKKKTMVATRKALANHAQFESGKDGMIKISVSEHDPHLASELTNFFVDALYGMNSTLAISEAAQRRVFYESQLTEEKAALNAAEEDLKSTQQKTGLLTLTGQTELVVRNIAQTRAEISAHEVKAQALRAYDSEENPDVIREQDQIATLRGQLADLENNQKHLSPGDTEVAANQVPVGGLEYARKLREVKYHEVLLQLLEREYEAARIDEAKSAPILQVVDRAVPPDQRSGPPRMLIVVGFGVLGFLAACGCIFLKSAVQRARQHAAVASKLDQLSAQLPWLPL